MLCPRCQVNLRPLLLNSVEVDTCDSCEGVWFDQDELKKVLDVYGEDLQSSSLAKSWEGEIRQSETPWEANLPCPKCHSTLKRYKYCYESEILIDGCEKGCGIWVDDGELKHIVRYLVESQKPLDPEKEKQIMEELKRIEEGYREREEKLMDGLVALDDRPGPWRWDGGLLQFIYNVFNRIGF